MFSEDEIKKLEDGLNGDNKKEAIRAIITAIETMVISMNEMKASVTALDQTCNDYKVIAESSQKANIDLTQAIKHIHLALNTERDLLPPSLIALSDELAKFVLSGAAIKIGVIANAK